MAKHRRFQEADLRGVDGQPPMMAVYTGKSTAGTDDGAFEDDASAIVRDTGWRTFARNTEVAASTRRHAGER
jgi:hypothetical protein